MRSIHWSGKGMGKFPLFAIKAVSQVSLLVSALDAGFDIASLIPLLQFSKPMQDQRCLW
jgi:hypothetical protein